MLTKYVLAVCTEHPHATRYPKLGQSAKRDLRERDLFEPLNTSAKMRKRKLTATIMDIPNDGSPTSSITLPDTFGSEFGGSRGVLQPRPNPPAKRTRQLRNSGKDKLLRGSCNRQGAMKHDSPRHEMLGGLSCLPLELWRLIGQKVIALFTALLLQAQTDSASIDRYFIHRL